MTRRPIAAAGWTDCTPPISISSTHDSGRLTPRVVGHLDIVRIYDPDYRSRLIKPVIWERSSAIWKLVKQLGLILDFNLRPLSRGEKSPTVGTHSEKGRSKWASTSFRAMIPMG
jgi:hypothetical protein